MKTIHIILAVFLTQFTAISYAQNDVDADTEKLNKFLKNLDQRYVDTVETSSLVEKGIRSMLEELDPHSVYMTPSQYKRSTEPLAGKYKGIGIRYRVIDDTLTVVEVIPGSPAEKGALAFGDQIIAVGSDTLSGKNLSSGKMSTLIKAEKNTDLPFAIIRDKAEKQIVLDRANVPVSSIASAIMLDESTGYIKLTRFSASSVSDFKKSLEKLENQGMKDLVFDLRGNSGGYLSAAIKITNEFLEDRKLIVYTEGMHQSKKETFANTGGRFTDGDLIVLIDERSASASEIVAGAIQDWDRGYLIGRRSYGKGLVQRTIEYDDGSAMRLTISRYYTPTGRSIQKPYDKGLKAYKSDLSQRRVSGELLSEDSIKVNDSLIYYTPNNRAVYGGGGIIPDKFVAADTNKPNKFTRDFYAKGLPYYAAINFTQANKNSLLSSYPTVADFTDRHTFSNQFIDELRLLAIERDVEVSIEDFENAKDKLTEDIRGIIARYAYGYEDQYYTLAKNDAAIIEAKRVLEDNVLQELGFNAD